MRMTPGRIVVLIIVVVAAFTILGCLSPNTESLISDGQKALKEEKFSEAIEFFDSAIKQSPESYPAYIGRAKANLMDGKYELSLADSEKALQIKKNDPEGLKIRAKSLEGLGRYDEAMKIYDDMVAKNKNDFEGYLLRGNVYAKKFSFREALNDYSEALKLNPESGEAYLNRGIVYHKMGKYALALKDYSFIIDHNLKPNGYSISFAYYNRAHVYYKMGDFKSAKADWKKITEIAPLTTESRESQAWLDELAKIN